MMMDGDDDSDEDEDDEDADAAEVGGGSAGGGWLQGLNINLVFTTFIIVFGSSFQFGYNIGVLNQVDEVSSSPPSSLYLYRTNETYKNITSWRYVAL